MPLQEGHDFPQELLLMSRPDVAARRIADKPRVWNVLGVTYRSQVCRWCGENCTQESVGMTCRAVRNTKSERRAVENRNSVPRGVVGGGRFPGRGTYVAGTASTSAATRSG